MKINFLFSILAISLISCSNEDKQSDREANGIKGNVKSILSIDYKAIDKFGQGDIVKEKPTAFGTEYSLYDSLGNILEHRHYYLSECLKRSEYEYDENGNEIKWTRFDEKDDSKIKYGYEYEYDDKGNKILEINIEDGSRGVVKNEYDENERLILKKSKDFEYSYKYTDDGKVKEWIFEDDLGNKRHVTYEYDEKGNEIKEILIIPKSEYECCFLSKYDSLSRVIDVIRINNPDADKGEVTQRVKYYYKGNANLPYRIVKWGENGDIEDETYTVWFSSESDTLSIIKLNKNNCITEISNWHKKKNNIIETFYDVKSEIFSCEKYHYTDGVLQSVIDENENTSSYEYDGNNLKRIIRQLTDGKSISVYSKGKIQSSTRYDKQNQIESEYIYEYTGDKSNGMQIIKFTDSEKKQSISELTFKNGKLVQSKNTQNGITEIIDIEYNEKGDIISANNKLKGEKITYVYKYDTFDNWYYKVEFKNDKAETITERSIEYFTF